VDENAHAFYIVVELAGRQRLHNGRYFRERTITLFLREENIDLKFHFPFHRRRIEQHFMRGNPPAERVIGEGGQHPGAGGDAILANLADLAGHQPVVIDVEPVPPGGPGEAAGEVEAAADIAPALAVIGLAGEGVVGRAAGFRTRAVGKQ